MSDAAILACSRCGRTIHRRENASQGYCEVCHDFTLTLADPATILEAVARNARYILWLEGRLERIENKRRRVTLARLRWRKQRRALKAAILVRF